MSGGIYLVGAGKKLVEMKEQLYDTEEVLLKRGCLSFNNTPRSDTARRVHTRSFLILGTSCSAPKMRLNLHNLWINLRELIFQKIL